MKSVLLPTTVSLPCVRYFGRSLVGLQTGSSMLSHIFESKAYRAVAAKADAIDRSQAIIE
jgi:hypothetical protein